MVNLQYFFLCIDIFVEVGIDMVFVIYDEVIVVVEVICVVGIMEYFIVMNMQIGWNVGEFFNFVFMVYGGEFFKFGMVEFVINSFVGVVVLNMFKEFVEYVYFDYLI